MELWFISYGTTVGEQRNRRWKWEVELAVLLLGHYSYYNSTSFAKGSTLSNRVDGSLPDEKGPL